MKINCNHDKSCGNCKHQSTCPLLIPSNKNHTLLLDEITYWRIELHKAMERILEYEIILNDIKNHRYSGVVNVYGNIQYYPLTNVFGVFIRNPEHVNYGWNYQRLVAEKDKLIEHLRFLNRKELNMRKILLKR